MRAKTEAEMERDRITKTVRSLIRLKHSLMADMEINNTLPELLDEYDASLMEGRVAQINVQLQELLGGN